MDLSTLTLASFEPHVATTFTIVVEDLREATVLSSATPLGAAPAPGVRAPFSLVFKAATRRTLPQRIYRLEHPVLGVMELFLVPILPDPDGQRYEAIFY
jgi:hypothetical protein